MRLKMQEHVRKGIQDYDREKVIEASEITKEKRDGKNFLLIDNDIRFEMKEEEIDRTINEVFRTGVMDLTAYKNIKLSW